MHQKAMTFKSLFYLKKTNKILQLAVYLDKKIENSGFKLLMRMYFVLHVIKTLHFLFHSTFCVTCMRLMATRVSSIEVCKLARLKVGA